MKSYDTPLSEITLRRYEKPYSLDKRELVRKLCLSLGILSPGDSRDVIVDVFYVMLSARKEEEMLSSTEIRKRTIELRKNNKLDNSGTAASNIRRQIKRLRDVFLVEKIKNEYRITEFAKTQETFQRKIERFLIPNILDRINTYLETLDKKFPRDEEKND